MAGQAGKVPIETYTRAVHRAIVQTVRIPFIQYAGASWAGC